MASTPSLLEESSSSSTRKKIRSEYNNAREKRQRSQIFAPRIASKTVKALSAFSFRLLLEVLSEESSTEVLFLESTLVGGVNGMIFDEDSHLYTCQVFGRAISKIDPDSGEILDNIDGPLFADDVAISPDDGTVYWGDVVLGTLFREGDAQQPTT